MLTGTKAFGEKSDAKPQSLFTTEDSLPPALSDWDRVETLESTDFKGQDMRELMEELYLHKPYKLDDILT